MPAITVSLSAREWAEIRAQAERLDAPIAAVVREAWRIARARILAAGARLDALRRAKGKKVEASRLLGIDRKRLYRKMKKYDLD